MRVFARIAAVGAAAVMAFGVGTASAQSAASLSFQAEEGAWPVTVPAGEWETADIREYQSVLIIDAEERSDWMRIELSGANGTPLSTGVYTDVRNRNVHPEGPGIQVISNGFGCIDDYATFTIERIERSDSGTLTGLDATLEQRCGDPVGPAFRARVRYSA